MPPFILHPSPLNPLDPPHIPSFTDHLFSQMSAPALSKAPVSSYSPFYGCGIIVAAAIVFGGIIAWSAYTLFRQDAEIESMTVAAPAQFAPLNLSPAEDAQLLEKLTRLKRSVQAGQPASLSLSIAELNAIIQKTPDLGNGTYAEIVRFTGTLPDQNALLADVSMRLNRLPFSKGPMRYLVGTATFTVEVNSEGPDTRITAIEVPGKTVPSGFIDSQHLWTWVAPFRKDEELASILKALRSARVTSTGLELSTQP